MTENEFTYQAFLSCSQLDNVGQRPDSPAAGTLCWGDWLAAELKAFSVPAAFVGQTNAHGEKVLEHIQPIFQDQTEQPENTSLDERTRQALDRSKSLVVICSPRSAKSLHVNEVVRYFKQLGRGNRILPVIIAGEPNASDALKPGVSADDECLVPALRHPVKSDGTLDTNRRERASIFADARHGDAKREILAADLHNGEIELETAKVQLVAGLVGVGFNGLWAHELKRRFAEAKALARSAHQQIPAAPITVSDEQSPAREAKIQELRNQVQEAQSKILEAQNQAREALGQVAEARHQAQSAESKVLEAQQLAQETQSQLESARNQVREAQHKMLEVQNLPQDVKSQIQEAQNQALEAQHQARNAQSQVEDARNQAREAQTRIQEIENQARLTESRLAEARAQAQAAEGKLLDAQQQAREAQTKIQALENQTREAQSQLQAVQSRAMEAQNHARANQDQVLHIQQQSVAARRLTKVFAVMAVLALMAAGAALWQRKQAAQAQTKPSSADTNTLVVATGPLTWEQIQQALQKFSGAGPDETQLRRLDELASRIPTNEIPETLTTSVAISDYAQRGHFQQLLLDYWARTNWPAAFDWSCGLTNVDGRTLALERIMPLTAADGFTNTLARLNDLKPAVGEEVYAPLFQRWAAINPTQAIEQRQAIPGQDTSGQILAAILDVWADQQPSAALQWLESQPDSEALPAGTWRNLMIAGLFDVWASKDLAAATSACQQLPEGTAKDKAWELILGRRIETDPASASQYVTNLPAGDYRQKAIEALCNNWAGTNALEWAQSLSSPTERDAALNKIVIHWAHQDPSAASEFARQHPELSGAVLGEIATAWFRRDVSATTNWVANLPEGEKKDAVLLSLVTPWLQRDPKGMATYALTLPAGETQTGYLTVACQQLGMRDFPGTVELLKPLTDDTLRHGLLEQAARNHDLPHLDSAAKYIAAMPAGEDQKAAISGLLSNWASADPAAAINWLGAFPETNAQPELVQSIVRSWSETEPAAVAKWLTNSPATTANEAAINAFLAGAAARYPDFAAQWATAITDEAKRQNYQVRLARQWLKTDPASAQKWIDTLNLPEALKQSVKDQSP